jgi:hypothetical protein
LQISIFPALSADRRPSRALGASRATFAFVMLFSMSVLN